MHLDRGAVEGSRLNLQRMICSCCKASKPVLILRTWPSHACGCRPYASGHSDRESAPFGPILGDVKNCVEHSKFPYQVPRFGENSAAIRSMVIISSTFYHLFIFSFTLTGPSGLTLNSTRERRANRRDLRLEFRPREPLMRGESGTAAPSTPRGMPALSRFGNRNWLKPCFTLECNSPPPPPSPRRTAPWPRHNGPQARSHRSPRLMYFRPSPGRGWGFGTGKKAARPENPLAPPPCPDIQPDRLRASRPSPPKTKIPPRPPAPQYATPQIPMSHTHMLNEPKRQPDA